MPRFSVIMPCFNAAETLDHSIQSVIDQTVIDWELICIDDGSTDGTCAMLREWQSRYPRIRMVRNRGKGPSQARNQGADQASGDILCFLDADDLWCCRKLESLQRAFVTDAVDGAYGQVAFFRQRGQADTYSTVPNTALDIGTLLGENPVCTMSNISVRRRLFQQVGGFDVDLVHNEDLDWLIRLVGQGAVIQPLSDLQVWYRTNLNGLSSNLMAMSKSRQRVVQTARGFGFEPDHRCEAIYLRYLARRALRIGAADASALQLTVTGLTHSPSAFLFPLRRGLMTAMGAFCAPLLPNSLRRSLFSR